MCFSAVSLLYRCLPSAHQSGWWVGRTFSLTVGFFIYFSNRLDCVVVKQPLLEITEVSVYWRDLSRKRRRHMGIWMRNSYLAPKLSCPCLSPAPSEISGKWSPSELKMISGLPLFQFSRLWISFLSGKCCLLWPLFCKFSFFVEVFFSLQQI